MAKLLREVTGENWQTTRNSGRTDLPGDVFCMSKPSPVMVECKHRKTWSVRDILLNNKAFRDEYEKVQGDWERWIDNGYPCLLIFVRTDIGLFVQFQAAESFKGYFPDGDYNFIVSDCGEWIALRPPLRGDWNALLYPPSS